MSKGYHLPEGRWRAAECCQTLEAAYCRSEPANFQPDPRRASEPAPSVAAPSELTRCRKHSEGGSGGAQPGSQGDTVMKCSPSSSVSDDSVVEAPQLATPFALPQLQQAGSDSVGPAIPALDITETKSLSGAELELYQELTEELRSEDALSSSSECRMMTESARSLSSDNLSDTRDSRELMRAPDNRELMDAIAKLRRLLPPNIDLPQHASMGLCDLLQSQLAAGEYLGGPVPEAK
ncbi:hypothetical protein WJX72_005153 [[Myrmecia] bisecta]|uniref:Uncharacterized protein n=1 Tax=[Myrmecia] bisecta TaxID=41462 RepID=A0AAW1R6S8_9CHLO